MPHISSVGQIKEIMDRHSLIFHKGLGQNFLFDANYLNGIADAGGISKDDTVVEIGPGLGVLTTRLAERAKRVVAVEIDKNIIPALKETVSEFPNVEIVNKDILKTDINELTDGCESVKVVANLPYYITSPIIMKLLEKGENIESVTVMIQKEVALRLAAKPGTKDYGAITVAVNYYSDPKIKLTVPPGAFIPPPKVYSSVITMKIREPEVTVCDEKLFFKIVKGAFGQRRKTLLNALSSAFPQISKENVKKIIASLGFDEKVRGETLSIADFAALSDSFNAKMKKQGGNV